MEVDQLVPFIMQKEMMAAWWWPWQGEEGDGRTGAALDVAVAVFFPYPSGGLCFLCLCFLCDALSAVSYRHLCHCSLRRLKVHAAFLAIRPLGPIKDVHAAFGVKLCDSCERTVEVLVTEDRRLEH